MAKFITNQNIELQLELASLGDRILAFIIDLLIIASYAIVMSFALSWFDELLYFISLIPLMFYSLAFETFGNGQSPGKQARNIKVVKLNGGSPTFANYLLRWLIRPIDIPLYGAIAMASIIVTTNGQRLGDLAAGTTVVLTKRRVSFEDIKPIQKEAQEIVFPQVKRLNDKQINLIRKALETKRDGFSEEGVKELAIKLKEIQQIKTDMPDVKFLYQIIRDYESVNAAY